MTHFIFALLLAGAVQGAPANPQQQQPPRATIEGIVVRAGTNEPIGRAQIIITRVAAPGAPSVGAPSVGAPGQPPAPPAANPANPPVAAGAPGAPGQPAAILPVLTESDGKFIVKDLPAGTYRISAARNGYSKQDYGQRSSRGPGTTITLQAGQSMKDVLNFETCLRESTSSSASSSRFPVRRQAWP